MDDLISRQAAIDGFYIQADEDGGWTGTCEDFEIFINGLPSAQPEIKPINYQDCANAMLRMWIDKVVTDGEYNRIMNKLNVFYADGERKETEDAS